mgnify:CR=1 FL=1
MLKSLKEWSLEIIGAIIIATLAFLWIRSAHESKVNAEAAAKALQAATVSAEKAALGDAAMQRAKDLQSALDTKESERQAALARVADLQAELERHPIPPKPGPAPTEQAQVIADLHDMGTSPEAEPPAKIAFPATDAPTLWTWGKESARVPALECRLSAEEALNQGLTLAVDTTTQQLKTTEKQRDEFKESAANFSLALTSEKAATGALTVQVDGLTQQRDRARKSRVWIGIGAFIIGAVAESKLH